MCMVDELVDTFIELIEYLPTILEETAMYILLVALNLKIYMEIIHNYLHIT